MNLTSGIFTAPRPGIYFFLFTGLAKFPASKSLSILGVGLYLNKSRIVTGWVEESNSVDNQDSPLTLQSTLNLNKGDQVFLQIIRMSSGVSLLEDSNNYTHFTGFLLDEEIVPFLENDR
jgi:hypothetical protein